jgi:hypothetical protein
LGLSQSSNPRILDNTGDHLFEFLSHETLFPTATAIVGLAGFAVYLADWKSGRVLPHPYSWLIWATTQSVATAGMWSSGGGKYIALAMTLWCTLSFLIFFLSLKTYKAAARRSDLLALTAAVIALAIWPLTKTPFWSIILVTIIDGVGYIPTIRKAMHNPASESPVGFLLFTAASAFTLLGLAAHSISTTLYPAVMLVANLSVFLTVICSKKIHRRGC